MEQKVAYFVVTGEALTEHARDLLLSEEPGQAYRLLADGLHGDGATEAALMVLQGTHELTGDSQHGIDLVEAEDSEALQAFKKQFRYIYAGRYRERGCWRRPVAWVAQFDREDGEWASREVGGTGVDRDGGRAKLEEWWKARARYYCRNNEEPIKLNLPGEGNVYVITEPCGELPHWMRPNLTPQEALNDAIKAGRSLDKRMSDRNREAEHRAASYEQLCLDIGEEVRKRAGEDTFKLKLSDGRELIVPRPPFVRWSLRVTQDKSAAPPWENVAPIGMKMVGDDPDHTDWVLGANLTITEAYETSINDASWNKAMEFQEEARNAREPPEEGPRKPTAFDGIVRQTDKRPFPGIFAALDQLNAKRHSAAVVVDAGERVGIVGTDIVVFPDSKGERVKELGKARGVIVEQGGELAHLIIVSKGRGITVMRHPNATTLFPPGTSVALMPAHGRITILEDE